MTEYIKLVFKHWKLLVVDLIGGTIFVLGLLKRTVPISVPIGLFIIFIGFTVAQFLAFYDLRKEKIKLTADLKEAKMFESKSQRIEIISNEKYPSEILRILNDMRINLSEIIESSDAISSITIEKLFSCIQGSPRDAYNALNQKSLDDNVKITFSFYRNFRCGIGLIDLQETNAKWKQLVEDLETTKKDIPDQELKDSIMTHFQALNGANSIRLFYHYMRKHGSTNDLVRLVEPFRAQFDLLDYTMTRVTKRILELKLGEEPKWEVKYFETRG